MGGMKRKSGQNHTQNILNGISQMRRTSPRADRLLEELSCFGDLILVGGAVRDLAHAKKPRDYDIIVDSTVSEFEEAFSGCSYKRNRFGGYKLKVDGIEFDIWGIQNNWAFRESLYDARFENISKGAFYNFDGLCFHLQKQRLDWHMFAEAMKEQVLDILLDDEAVAKNPTPEVNIVRAWVIHKTWHLQLSERVRNYIRQYLDSVDDPYECLRQAERKHYGTKCKLSHDEYQQFFMNFAT